MDTERIVNYLGWLKTLVETATGKDVATHPVVAVDTTPYFQVLVTSSPQGTKRMGSGAQRNFTFDIIGFYNISDGVTLQDAEEQLNRAVGALLTELDKESNRKTGIAGYKDIVDIGTTTWGVEPRETQVRYARTPVTIITTP